ncbi:MAG: MFS transporter [Candidatus Melainabacteria bacterium]|nr:MFS transporter [Candidatus Melainabacteria bacterium]
MSKEDEKDNQPANQGRYPGATQALLLLLAINIFNYVDRQILSAVVPMIRTEFFGPGSDPGPFVGTLLGWLERILGSNPENAMIGLTAMAFMVTYMLAAPIAGMLNIKRWWIVAGGVALWSLASGATGFATTFGMLLLTRCLVGIGEAAYGPIAPTIIADMFPLKERGKMLSWFYLAIPVGSALGFIFGGLIAAWLGWRWAFYLVVPPGLILAVWAAMKVDPLRGQFDKGGPQLHKRKLTRQDYIALAKNKSYVLNTLGMAAMTFAIGGMAFWMPSYISEFRGVGNLAQVNLIFGVILVASGLGATLAGTYMADKLRARFKGSYFSVSGLAILIGLPFFIATLYVPFPYAWACIFVSCFCLFFNTGPTNTILANVTEPAIRSSAFALNILVIHALGDVISPLVIGVITDVFDKNMNIAFLAMSGVMAIGGGFWLWGAKYLEADTAKISGPDGE